MAAPRIQRPQRPRHRQRGLMLLEALIAILIFSVGILGVVGLQATAVQQSTDARYRTEAALLAEQLLGMMWVDNRSWSALRDKYSSCGAASCTGYNDWVEIVAATLPGITEDNQPVVEVTDKGIVTIELSWRAPGEQDAEEHKYSVQTQIGQ